MKNIKTSFKAFNAVNESIIKPYDYGELLSQIKENALNITSFEDINHLCIGTGVQFVDYDTFYSTLVTDTEREKAPPKEMKIFPGLQFALFNKHINQTQIVVMIDELMIMLKTDKLHPFIKLLHEILRHESIHAQQVQRSDKNSYSLERAPGGDDKGTKEYFSHHTEQMAYAQSMVDQMKAKGLSKAQMLDSIKDTKKTETWVHDIYKKVLTPKEMQKFMKYVYLYINEVEE